MTHWRAVLVLFGAGCSLATHMGKVPSALPLLRDDFALSLTATGAIVALYAALIAMSGLALGLLVARIGYREFAIGGVALAGLASLLGASSESLTVLLFARALEGAGWIVAAIALPAIIGRLASVVDRPLALGLWGAFVPVGTGCMLIVAPALQDLGGWRLSWQVAGAVSLCAAVAAALACRRHDAALAGLASTARPAWRDLRSPVTLLMSASFFCYSFQFLAVVSFLPTFFIDHDRLSLSLAAALVALVMLCNALGNVAAGRLLQRGAPPWLVLAGAAALSSSAAALAYLEPLPLLPRLLAALLFSLFGGAIPGTLFASVPRAASVAASAGPIVGLMLQVAGLGQLLGPLVLPALVERSGSWSAAGFVAAFAGVSGVVLALLLRRVESSRDQMSVPASETDSTRSTWSPN